MTTCFFHSGGTWVRALEEMTGSPKSLGYIFWEPWMSVQSVLQIHPVDFEISVSHFGPNWWNDRSTLPSLELCSLHGLELHTRLLLIVETAPLLLLSKPFVETCSKGHLQRVAPCSLLRKGFFQKATVWGAHIFNILFIGYFFLIIIVWISCLN